MCNSEEALGCNLTDPQGKRPRQY
uniref:Uncharacterized protein n=1 Tax=Arundo donax TaxID=35708 RepID=A0A0A9QD27_ARUDO